jgi:hypothetical protein
MELLEQLSKKQLLTKDFFGLESGRQEARGVVQIRTVGVTVYRTSAG